jgi:hypothetical protein
MRPPQQYPTMPTLPASAAVSRGDVVGAVAEIDVAFIPVKKRRGDRQITIGRIAIADTPDMAVDAEDFLHDDKAAAWRAIRVGAVRRQLEAIARYEFDHAGHGCCSCCVSIG